MMTLAHRFRAGLLAGLCLVLCGVLPGAARADEAGWPFAPELWRADEAEAGGALRAQGFRALDASGGSGLRAMPVREPALGLRAMEGLASFREGRLAELSLLFFSRGDAGEMDQAAFDAGLKTLSQRLGVWSDTAGFRQQREARSGMIRESHVWVREPMQAALEWGYTAGPGGRGGFRAEYIRLRLQPYDASRAAMLAAGVQAPAAPRRMLTVFDLRKRLVTDPDGARVISNVPMVDQGPKGYCVAATVERALRYFDREFDQHQLAQMAGSSATEGTSADAMLQALRRMSTPLSIRISELVHDRGTTIISDPAGRGGLRLPQGVARTIREYNRAAKRAGRPEISDAQILATDSLLPLYERMDRALLKASRNQRAADRDAFFANIRRHIDAGVPLAWTLLVGLVPEAERTVGIAGLGGHMRMIIGYHPSTREIIYTDSWGRGHEAKRMALEDAWVGTMGLYAIMPRDFRF
jgi:hypothetical protein